PPGPGRSFAAARPDRVRHPGSVRVPPRMAAGRSGNLGQPLHNAPRAAVRRDRNARPAPGHNARPRIDARRGRLKKAAQMTPNVLRDAVTEDFQVIDLGDYLRSAPGALGKVARQLRHALENIGFLLVVNHGVADDLTEGIVEQARRFHAMPLAEKIRL